MDIDTSMYGRMQPVQIENPLDQYARISQVQAMQQRNRLTEAMFAEKDRELQQDNALAAAYKNALKPDGTVDRSALISSAAQSGLGGKIPTLQKTFADQDKATADLEKARWDATSKKLEIAGQAFGYVRNNPTLEAANSVLDYLGQNGVYDAATVDQYKRVVANDPSKIKALADQAFQSVLGAKEQLSSYQTRNTGGTTDTIEINPVTGQTKVVNSVKNTMTPDAIAADARGRESNAIARQRLAFDQSQPKGQYDPERGVLVDPRTGTARSVTGPDGAPLGPKDKLPEAQQKQVVGVQNLSSAIQEYRDELKNFGFGAKLNPDRRAIMGTKYNNMMLQAKEAYNLGVLNGPDLEILTSVITDPRSLKGAITSNSALDQQASELDRIMQGVGKVASQPKPRVDGVKPSAAAAGPKPGTVEGGYRFKGGNPADPNSWEKAL